MENGMETEHQPAHWPVRSLLERPLVDQTPERRSVVRLNTALHVRGRTD